MFSITKDVTKAVKVFKLNESKVLIFRVWKYQTWGAFLELEISLAAGDIVPV